MTENASDASHVEAGREQSATANFVPSQHSRGLSRGIDPREKLDRLERVPMDAVEAEQLVDAIRAEDAIRAVLNRYDAFDALEPYQRRRLVRELVAGHPLPYQGLMTEEERSTFAIPARAAALKEDQQ